jgi:GntR family transcriptional regulator
MAATVPRIDERDPRPIWSQIEEGLLAAIATRSLAPGEPLPSVRDLAKRLRVNPNTVAKVYQRLIDGGFAEARRGEGTFVAAAPPALPARERQRRLGEAADRFALTSAAAGATEEDAVAAARRALARHALREEETQ